jgi:transposase
VEEHGEGMVAYYDHPISTGSLEGTNTKIQTMKRQSYGFRDRNLYKFKLLGIDESPYALVG